MRNNTYYTNHTTPIILLLLLYSYMMYAAAVLLYTKLKLHAAYSYVLRILRVRVRVLLHCCTSTIVSYLLMFCCNVSRRTDMVARMARSKDNPRTRQNFMHYCCCSYLRAVRSGVRRCSSTTERTYSATGTGKTAKFFVGTSPAYC